MVILNTFVIIVAKYFFIIPILIWIYVFLSVKRSQMKRIIVFSALSGLIAILLGFLAGNLYFDTRPFVAGNYVPLIPHSVDNGFPSDHTLVAAVASSIIILMSLNFGIVSWALTLLVGWARVYAGLHHWIDVIGAIVIAAISCSIAYWITKKTFD